MLKALEMVVLLRHLIYQGLALNQTRKYWNDIAGINEGAGMIDRVSMLLVTPGPVLTEMNLKWLSQSGEFSPPLTIRAFDAGKYCQWILL